MGCLGLGAFSKGVLIAILSFDPFTKKYVSCLGDDSIPFLRKNRISYKYGKCTDSEIPEKIYSLNLFDAPIYKLENFLIFFHTHTHQQ